MCFLYEIKSVVLCKGYPTRSQNIDSDQGNICKVVYIELSLILIIDRVAKTKASNEGNNMYGMDIFN